MTARNRPGGRQRELYPPLVARAHALARQAVFPLTREEAGPGRPSACLPGVGRFLAMLAAGCTGGAEDNPGRFEVMFRPALLHTGDPEFQRAGDAAFQALHSHIASCQRRGWHPGTPTDALAAGAWALAHGIAVLRMQGSLARHYPDRSLSGVGQLVTAMTATAPR